MKLPTDEGVDFGALPEDIDGLLQQGVRAYRRDRQAADRFFRVVLDLSRGLV